MVRDTDKNLEQRQAKWRNFYQASGGKIFVVCDNRSLMRNIRSEINYCLGNKPLTVSLTNLGEIGTMILLLCGFSRIQQLPVRSYNH